jgi:predicted metal-dependent peptidase
MKNRDAKVWNRSCDIAINLLLESFERVGQRPEDEVLLKKFDNMSVEAIYEVLYEENKDEESQEETDENEEKFDLIEEEGDTKEYEADIDAIIIQAIAAAKKAGNIPASLLELISEITKPKIDLQTLLHAYMSESFFDKVTDFSRPNRRFIHQGIYLPGYRQEKNRLSLSIALDKSMSITTELFKQFLGIIDTVLALSSDYKVTVIPFDDHIDETDIITYDSNSSQREIAFSKGNGGTDFSVVAKYLEKYISPWDSTFLIVLSDGFFSVKKMVEMPTIFLISEVKNIERLKPYGDVIRFDL